MVGFIAYVWCCIKNNINNLNEEPVKAKYGAFYNEYDVSGYGKWTTVSFLTIRLISVLGVVYGNTSPYLQLASFFVVNLAAASWTIIVRPHSSKPVLVGAILSDLSAVVTNCVYFKLCDPNLSDLETEALGDFIFYLYISVSSVNVAGGLMKSGYEIYEWWSTTSKVTPDQVYSTNKTTDVINKNSEMFNNSNIAQPGEGDFPTPFQNNFMKDDPLPKKPVRGSVDAMKRTNTKSKENAKASSIE